MNSRLSLGSFHSSVCLVYFLLVILGTVLSFHPVFLAFSLLGSILFYLSLRGPSGLKVLLRLLPFSLAVLLLNPIFNSAGDTVLFRYLGRAFTLEALLYGISIALMILSVMIWFLCLNLVLPSDRLLSLCAPLLPSFSLLVVLVVRLLPVFFIKARQILALRKAIGKGQEETLRERIHSGATALSALSGWTLEGSVITADSMKARGYGCGKRSSFRLESFGRRDFLLLLVLLFLSILLITGMVMGGLEVLYIPAFRMTGFACSGFLPGLLGFLLLCFLPCVFPLFDYLIDHGSFFSF